MSLDIVVAGYIVNKGELLLIHHKKLDKWLPVGGHIERDETPDDALRREIKEEVGIDVKFVMYPPPREGNNLEYAFPFHIDKHQISEDHFHYCLFYLCRPDSLGIQIDKKEVVDYGWFNKRGLTNLVPPLNQGIIETCLQAIFLDELEE